MIKYAAKSLFVIVLVIVAKTRGVVINVKPLLERNYSLQTNSTWNHSDKLDSPRKIVAP